MDPSNTLKLLIRATRADKNANYASMVCCTVLYLSLPCTHSFCSIATKDLIGQAQFGLDIKAQVLPVYEKVFDIDFPLPKLDTLVVGLCRSCNCLRQVTQLSRHTILTPGISLSSIANVKLISFDYEVPWRTG
jgi:hypothetical protein